MFLTHTILLREGDDLEYNFAKTAIEQRIVRISCLNPACPALAGQLPDEFTDNELVTKSEISTTSNRHRLKIFQCDSLQQQIGNSAVYPDGKIPTSVMWLNFAYRDRDFWYFSSEKYKEKH